MHDWGWHNMMWVIWIPIIVLAVWLILRMTDTNESKRTTKETPFEILKRRYANGEITAEEFDKRKKKLQE